MSTRNKTALLLSRVTPGLSHSKQAQLIKRIIKWANNGDDIDVRITDREVTALHMAISKGADDIAEALIGLHCNVNVLDENDSSPLHYAARKGSLRIVKSLVRAGASMFARQWLSNFTPLHDAIWGGHMDVVTYLFSQGAPTSDSQVPFFCTGRRYDESDIKAMIDAGCDIFAQRGDDESSALHGVARYCNESCINLLLEAGAEVDSLNKTGTSPLMVAASYANCDAIKALIVAGADIDIANHHGCTAFHLLLLLVTGDVTSLVYLLAAGALFGGREILDMANANGRTPVDVAVKFGRLDHLWYLIAAGASYKHVDLRSFFESLRSGTKQERILLLRKEIDAKCREIIRLIYRRLSGRASTLCIALQSLHLPALVTLSIVDILYDPKERVSMHGKWTIIALVKHFLPN